MKSSFTDLFIKRPVLAIVVNVVIIIAGLQAYRSLNVRQYPRSDNATHGSILTHGTNVGPRRTWRVI